MDGQSSQNELQLMSLDFGGNDYGVSQLAENHPYQNYFLEDGSDGFNYMSPPLPQWIQCQQNTPKYVEFLAENGVSELQVDISHSDISSMTCSFQHTVPFLDMNVKQTENSNDGHCNASQPHSSALPPKPHRKVLLRKRAYASDRNDCYEMLIVFKIWTYFNWISSLPCLDLQLRRLRIAERLNALQELLPQSKEGDKATVLDDIINLLQEQIKVQSMEHAHNCLLPMGITSENVANRYGVTRQDQAAVDSHRKVAAVTASGKFKEEIVPVHTKIVDPKTGDEKLVTIFVDDGIRESTIVVDLTKLRPAFKKDGTTTVGNSSQVSDGAGAILLMKRSVAVQKGLPILSL